MADDPKYFQRNTDFADVLRAIIEDDDADDRIVELHWFAELWYIKQLLARIERGDKAGMH